MTYGLCSLHLPLPSIFPPPSTLLLPTFPPFAFVFFFFFYSLTDFQSLSFFFLCIMLFSFLFWFHFQLLTPIECCVCAGNFEGHVPFQCRVCKRLMHQDCEFYPGERDENDPNHYCSYECFKYNYPGASTLDVIQTMNTDLTAIL